ncbi:hypothetical protein M3Y99_01129600 [Aphelenchoides fujianensis]|nr:hypothetical protein M3Y99_01129600 [Aphelenchoides fujianensis]
MTHLSPPADRPPGIRFPTAPPFSIQHAWGFRREMLWPSLRRLTAEKVVYVCCELRKPVCGPVHRSNFEGDGGIQLSKVLGLVGE